MEYTDLTFSGYVGYFAKDGYQVNDITNAYDSRSTAKIISRSRAISEGLSQFYTAKMYVANELPTTIIQDIIDSAVEFADEEFGEIAEGYEYEFTNEFRTQLYSAVNDTFEKHGMIPSCYRLLDEQVHSTKKLDGESND